MIEARCLGLAVYRLFEEGELIGFTLSPVPTSKGQRCERVVSLRSDENGLAVYLFSSKEEAEVFLEGMLAAGEDPALSAIGYSNLDCWAVLREIENPDAWHEMSGGLDYPMVHDMRRHAEHVRKATTDGNIRNAGNTTHACSCCEHDPAACRDAGFCAISRQALA